MIDAILLNCILVAAFAAMVSGLIFTVRSRRAQNRAEGRMTVCCVRCGADAVVYDPARGYVCSLHAAAL